MPTKHKPMAKGSKRVQFTKEQVAVIKRGVLILQNSKGNFISDKERKAVGIVLLKIK